MNGKSEHKRLLFKSTKRYVLKSKNTGKLIIDRNIASNE